MGKTSCEGMRNLCTDLAGGAGDARGVPIRVGGGVTCHSGEPRDVSSAAASGVRSRRVSAGHVQFGAVASVGLVYAVAGRTGGMSDRGLCDVTFGLRRDVDYRRRLGHRVPEIWRDDATLREVRAEFVAYFDGRTRKFSIPTDLRGVTPFVRAVLRLAKRLPFGRVTSYGSLAGSLGRPRASRAVGRALGRNPVPIVIPCHRVVRATGKLGGYVGGARAKRALLRLEGAIA